MSRPHMSAMNNDDIDDLLGWPQLDPAALHGLAGQIVESIEPHSEAAPAALLKSSRYLLASPACLIAEHSENKEMPQRMACSQLRLSPLLAEFSSPG
jgi:hypothetical protein